MLSIYEVGMKLSLRQPMRGPCDSAIFGDVNRSFLQGISPGGEPAKDDNEPVFRR